MKTDMKNATFKKATQDALATLGAIQKLQSDPAVPDAAINGPWQAALAEFLQAYQAYRVAFGGGTGTHIDTGDGDLNEGIAQLATLNRIMGPLTGETIVLTS
ncbi:MAG TPA: hypothetical protein VMB82_11350 [Acidimicrobiales bacterium]|nr:hypothetical protein [Acidimicrobiales bacterium]